MLPGLLIQTKNDCEIHKNCSFHRLFSICSIDILASVVMSHSLLQCMKEPQIDYDYYITVKLHIVNV